jgi:nucleoside-diphosphate-sugar epimerase
MDSPLLVVGGSGFIGLNIVEALLAKGETVVLHALDAPPAAARADFAQLPGRLVCAAGDAADTQSLVALVREHKVRRIVYGAAITAGPQRERQSAARILSVNAVAAVALYQALAGNELARFVYLSSVAVYGAAGYGDVPTAETIEPIPDSLYAISKYTTERSLARLRDAARGDTVCLRLGPAFGPWEYSTGLRDTLSPPYELLRHARQGRTCLLPRAGIRDWIYAPDIGAAVASVLAAAQPLAPVYNVGAGRTASLLEFAHALQQRYPHFDARVAETPQDATLDLYAPHDRAMLDTTQLGADVGFQATHDVSATVAAWLAWLDRHPDFAPA